MVYFNFLNFIAFFWEFWITRRVGIKRNDNFYCLLLLLFQPIFAWKEAITVFFNSLLFFWNFLLRVVEERNRTIIFISTFSRPFPTYFGLKLTQNDYFFIFLLFFWNFLLRVGLERSGTIIFIFSLSQRFPPYFGLKWSHNSIL